MEVHVIVHFSKEISYRSEGKNPPIGSKVGECLPKLQMEQPTTHLPRHPHSHLNLWKKKKEEEDPTQYKLKLPVLLLLAEIGVQYTHSYLVCERCD